MSTNGAGKWWVSVALVACLLGQLACSPALNWRVVRLDKLAALLPCKPDRAVRTVRLANQALEMGMAGCEAHGALFAVSHVRVTDVAAVEPTLQAWRASALERMQSVTVQAVGTILHAKGQQPGGDPVHAQLTWRVVGLDIFHAAVYAPQLQSDLTEPFFSELRTP